MAKYEGFVLQADGQSDVQDPSEAQIKKVLISLRSQGPISFASLTDAGGNFVQAAGGQATCIVEKRTAADGRIYRAFQDKRSAVFPDGAVLSFNAGNVSVNSDEWFRVSDALELFAAFASGMADPAIFKWRDMSERLR